MGGPYARYVLLRCRPQNHLVSFVSLHAASCGVAGSDKCLIDGLTRANDTRDTKPSSRDTPTIHGLPTMTAAGALNVDFVAKAVT
jgi:hypothetical protein